MNQLQKATAIQSFRQRAIQNDSPELQKQRQEFLDYLACRCLTIPRVFEMYPGEDEAIKGKKRIGQYMNEYLFANTRTQLPTETRAETDKLDFEKAVNLISEICLELIKQNYSFSVFYAIGQRSPHIIIYDFEQLAELSPYQRMKARAKFWRMIIPFRIHLLDQSLWDDSHFVPLEYAPHWKYGTPFVLLFEYQTEQKIEKKCIKREEEKPKVLTPEEYKEFKIKRDIELRKQLEEYQKQNQLKNLRRHLENLTRWDNLSPVGNRGLNL